MNWTRRQLTLAESWSPWDLLRPDPGSLWATPTLAFDVLFDRILPRPLPRGDVPGIRPVDLDPGSGMLNVRSTRDLLSGFAVSRKGLQVGDLLVHPRVPVVLVTTPLASFRFSSSFLAVRPTEGLDPMWAWLALNTTPGMQMRALFDDTQRLDLGALFNRGVLPVVPEPAWESLKPAADELLQRVNAGLSVVDRGQSWWRRTELADPGNWLVQLAVRDPAELVTGVPLGELIKEPRRGRTDRARTLRDEAAQALVRFDVRHLRVGRSDEWVQPDPRDVIAQPGDVLLASVGADNLALPVATPCVVGADVFSLQVRPGVDPVELARALNSPAGRRQREIYSSSSAVRFVRRTDVLKMRVRLGDEPAPPALDLAREADRLAGQWI